ncbi:hypothetical protein Aple_025160 [Acrocarpospora pleiomorpha]|uniref:Uncharacterized protein n=1 Tax=Acrocarpospora pleiomorpha TaxID=90975 RepID=A0A5M3XEY5_9ACTN|nr:hypothetical protein [Acrocarpospora pleiomorpha]GES19620.1 hypothetical protein Aple_025160 [Acrocarpospora pleiomorpha]
MVKRVVRVMLMVVMAGISLAPTSAQAASQGTGAVLVGRVSNGTSYDITAVRFNTSVDHTDCTVWNGVNGGPARSEYTFTTCQRYNIGAGTISGTLLDLDGFRPALSYPPSYYMVRFGSGAWRVIDWYHYTRITDSEYVGCKNGSVYMECTIYG